MAEERRLNRELRAALKDAMQVSEMLRPTDQFDVELQLSRLPQISSISSLRLKNPGEYRVDTTLEENTTWVVSLAEIQHLARTMDIDMSELETNVTAIHAANTGNTGLGIATEPDLWRIRLLDDAMHIDSLSDISVPLDQLVNLHITPARVLIVENLISLLTLPAMDDAVAIFGRGNSVPELAKLPWLHDAEVYYWGDLDIHGLRILHILRAAGVEATSILMDLSTLQQFQDLWAAEATPFTGTLNLLTTAETKAFEYLQAHPGTRLEQERIDWSHVLEVLRDRGLLSEPLD